MATTQAQNRADLALIKRDVIDVVADKIRQFQENRELVLPPNYSAENAIKAAWLAIQATTDKTGRPALETCTKDSIANALLDMVVQGLTPSKRQCYFVVYGNKLVCMRSYFGSMALVKRILPEADIWYGVVYEGDEFEYAIEHGRKRILKHIQKIENVKPDKIVAAYCVIEPGGDRPPYTEIMTIDQIKAAWRQGQTYREGGNSPHNQFPDQMAVKTVINRACKYVINSSSDDYLLLQHANRGDEIAAEAEFEEEVRSQANGEIIDIEFDEPGSGGQVDELPADEQPAPNPEPQPDTKPEHTASPKQARQQRQAALFDDGPGY